MKKIRRNLNCLSLILKKLYLKIMNLIGFHPNQLLTYSSIR